MKTWVCDACKGVTDAGAKGWKLVRQYGVPYVACAQPTCKERVTVMVCNAILAIPAAPRSAA